MSTEYINNKKPYIFNGAEYDRKDILELNRKNRTVNLYFPGTNKLACVIYSRGPNDIVPFPWNKNDPGVTIRYYYPSTNLNSVIYTKITPQLKRKITEPYIYQTNTEVDCSFDRQDFFSDKKSKNGHPEKINEILNYANYIGEGDYCSHYLQRYLTKTQGGWRANYYKVDGSGSNPVKISKEEFDKQVKELTPLPDFKTDFKPHAAPKLEEPVQETPFVKNSTPMKIESPTGDNETSEYSDEVVPQPPSSNKASPPIIPDHKEPKYKDESKDDDDESKDDDDEIKEGDNIFFLIDEHQTGVKNMLPMNFNLFKRRLENIEDCKKIIFAVDCRDMKADITIPDGVTGIVMLAVILESYKSLQSIEHNKFKKTYQKIDEQLRYISIAFEKMRNDN